MPNVSIIVPVYNAEAVLRRCVDSILAQEFRDFELLLMDDGSKDSSGAICDEYASMDGRVRVVHKENSGVSDTRNQALDMARGEYIQFLDADDWIVPEATRLFVYHIETSHADMVIADFYRVVGDRISRKGSIEEEGLITRNEFADYMAKSPADYYYGVIWNKFFRRDLIESFGLRMDASLRWCEDFIFNLEYLLHVENVYVLRVDGAIPGLPGTKKLGEERVLVSQEPQVSSCWEGIYYEQRMLDRIIRTASQQYGLDPRDLKLFLYLRTFGHIGTMQEAADYVGLSPMLLAALIERLAFRGYVKLEFGKPATAELTPQAKPVVDTLDLGLKDLEESELENMDEDVAKSYQEARALAAGNLRKRLER